MRNVLATTLVLFLALWSSLVCAQAQGGPAFQEGKHFLKLPNGLLESDAIENFRKSEPNSVQVIEFFSYGCGWCYKLEEDVRQWMARRPDYIAFHRVPVEFHPAWSPLTKVYFTAKTLGVEHKIHEPFFEAIHSDRIQTTNEKALGEFFQQHGVKPDDFNQAYSSFDVARMQKWAQALSQAYRITAIPSFVVQGPGGAYLTSVRMAESAQNVFEVINMLTAQQYQLLQSPEVSQ
jgi:thiol:disulfide interchange protein DsbA